jgi:prolyl 4-hydroxylase
MGRFRACPTCSVLSLALLCTAARAGDVEEVLHGWQGESFDKAHIFGTDQLDPGKDRWIETLSWHPRSFLFHNFLSAEEADALVVQAAPQMKRSTVVGDPKKGPSAAIDNIRTSYGTFLGRLSSPAVERMEKLLANWTQLPIIHQEDVQVRRKSCLLMRHCPETVFWDRCSHGCRGSSALSSRMWP